MDYFYLYNAIPAPTRHLKFRQVKIQVSKDQKLQWRVLNRMVNFPITDGTSLREALIQLELKGYKIIRVYSTISKWLDPVTLSIKNKRGNYLLESWMVLESDFGNEISLQMARALYHELYDHDLDPIIVMIGSRSIHLWFKFDYERYLIQSQDKLNRIMILNPNHFFYLERVARKRLINILMPEELMYTYLDWRTTLDIRRIVPVIGTLNNWYDRKITEITPKELMTQDYSRLIGKCLQFTGGQRVMA